MSLIPKKIQLTSKSWRVLPTQTPKIHPLYIRNKPQLWAPFFFSWSKKTAVAKQDFQKERKKERKKDGPNHYLYEERSVHYQREKVHQHWEEAAVAIVRNPSQFWWAYHYSLH
jgi:hypothetical protein